MFSLFNNYFSFDQAIKLNPENDTYWHNKGAALNS